MGEIDTKPAALSACCNPKNLKPIALMHGAITPFRPPQRLPVVLDQKSRAGQSEFFNDSSDG
jgi:hypothetical protein